MRASSIRSKAVVFAALAMPLALAGCSTATPVLIQGGTLPTLQGRASTTAGYTGEITTDNQSCRGSFTGTAGHPVVTLEISCVDGRSGIGTATLADGVFVLGEVRMNDGTLLTVRQRAAAYP